MKTRIILEIQDNNSKSKNKKKVKYKIKKAAPLQKGAIKIKNSFEY